MFTCTPILFTSILDMLDLGVVMGYGLNNAFKLFSSKLYKIRDRFLDFLVQNPTPFTTSS